MVADYFNLDSRLLLVTNNLKHHLRRLPRFFLSVVWFLATLSSMLILIVLLSQSNIWVSSPNHILKQVLLNLVLPILCKEKFVNLLISCRIIIAFLKQSDVCVCKVCACVRKTHNYVCAKVYAKTKYQRLNTF